MRTKRFFSLLLSCLLILGCLTAPAGAAVNTVAIENESEEVIARATGQFEKNISANTIYLVRDSFILDSGDVVSYDCSYTPRDANVKFGYIGPDGLFYGISGYKGSINKGIRVNQHGTYTLAIWNESNESVYVWGTVDY